MRNVIYTMDEINGSKYTGNGKKYNLILLVKVTHSCHPIAFEAVVVGQIFYISHQMLSDQITQCCVIA